MPIFNCCLPKSKPSEYMSYPQACAKTQVFRRQSTQEQINKKAPAITSSFMGEPVLQNKPPPEVILPLTREQFYSPCAVIAETRPNSLRDMAAHVGCLVLNNRLDQCIMITPSYSQMRAQLSPSDRVHLYGVSLGQTKRFSDSGKALFLKMSTQLYEIYMLRQARQALQLSEGKSSF